jgi:pimeloyl-ACP methyl ester carboxylesterase
MNQKTALNPADYILPLYMDGLSGRMLRLPTPSARKKREILFVYGHHTSLERIFGVAEYLNKFGSVTVPDLPGFGGMDSFYKIDEKPTLDSMADYLAAFIKMRYRNKRFSVAGYSLGFMIVTRMLQKYPEIAKKVDIVVSCAGFASKDDFVFRKRNFLIFNWGSWLFSHRLPAAFLRIFVLRKYIIKTAYKIVENKHSKLKDANDEERAKRVAFEIGLWQNNDIRTYMYMGLIMFRLNLVGRHVDLPVHHVSIDGDRYFDNAKVEQHMREIYNDCFMYKAHQAKTHSPSVIGTAEEAAPYIPPALRKVFNKKP